MLDLISLKLKYGRIFKATTPISKLSIYFKLISKLEYDTYIRLAPEREIISPMAEEYIFRVAIIYPDITTIENKLLAGEYHSIAEAIASRSGFHQIQLFSSELKSKRLEAQTLSEQIIGTIAKAFPIYKISDLDAMNYQEIARLLALAEALLEVRLDIPGAEIAPPPESNKEKQEQNIITPRPQDPALMSATEQAAIERSRENALEALQASRSRRLF